MDSTMQIKRFTYDDLTSERFEKYKTSSSTNRLAENPDDLTQEVIIIDGDEIRKFGYTTLADVLKTIPGFRTSQPRNAIEGETFLMRGLLGNDHTKILINGIPIKPEAVKSMPIAAQLPIRHAEYIEIVQGPSSATYGSDAMAGVINIVLPEVDRPVFAWADVSGVTPATTDINLTLGGKAGKGKNVLNYQIFASSQTATNLNLRINRDSVLIDPSSLNQWEQQYYLPDKDDPEVPEVNSLIRLSRLIGGNFQFRGFELFATRMYREEHSALGFSPLAISYSDPSTTMGENINSVGLHSGPVVAGVIGIKKFAYDIWGDTVNTAARMESSGEVGKVNISGKTKAHLNGEFQTEHRGKVEAKNKGAIEMYFVERK